MALTSKLVLSLLVALTLVTRGYAMDIQRVSSRRDKVPENGQVSSKCEEVSNEENQVPDSGRVSSRNGHVPTEESRVPEIDPVSSKQLQVSSRQNIGVFDDVDLYTVIGTLTNSLLLLLACVYFIHNVLIAPVLTARSLSSLENWSFALDQELLERALNSIDPVESVFSFMKIDEDICKERTVCELQRASSNYPLIRTAVEYVSPYIWSLRHYKGAQEAGAALEDCAVLFAECPYSIFQ
ncbi:uncharacterized protein LOC135220102 [Macrobrachium nipponense]|uniref:uncharacterized protein LOC135220102 n=1 Tax=Macrobrachium nipponense TaxID=159736 RepID=UPI0030C7BF8E